MTFKVFHTSLIWRVKMNGEMKNRLALLSILLVTGLVTSGIATVSGASSSLKFAGKEVRVVAIGEQLKIYMDGKLVKEITLPEEGEYNFTVEAAGHKLQHKITTHKMTEEEIKEAQAEHEKMMNKWLEIANKDSRIQELTNGEGIHPEDAVWAESYGDEVILTVKVEGKYYKITIDLNSEKVKSVEEVK